MTRAKKSRGNKDWKIIQQNTQVYLQSLNQKPNIRSYQM